jgi:precorrin-8X/cobalt-precorrin-8 methylmutase
LLFDTYIIVDWSASTVPKRGRDSIWICRRHSDGEEQLRNPPTRYAAKSLLAEMIGAAIQRGERVLAGFDFPFGYPAGFARQLGYHDAEPWRVTWNEIARLIKDDDTNRNNRFWVGAEFNRRISGKQFPFWGCPASKEGVHLGQKFHKGHNEKTLAERRLIDCWMTGAQPCWKLAYTGSVGSQSLTGIPVVQALRDDPSWADRARIWPFETGLQEPTSEARIVFAEVWPSWWRDWKTTQQHSEVNDRAQVRHVARVLAEEDAAGVFAARFAGDPSLTGAQRAIIESEEAWTLGVVERRPRKASSRLPKAAK